jgi:hypothetical protein
MEFVDRNDRRLRDPHTDSNADRKSGDNTYATATHANPDPKPGDNTDPNTISDGHTSDPNTYTYTNATYTNAHSYPDSNPTADTYSDSGGAGGQPVDEDERSDRR